MATIFIIAKEPKLRQFYNESYSVIAVKGTPEALRIIETRPVDITLLDATRTNGNGLACVQEMLKRQRYLKIIITIPCSFFEHDSNLGLADRFVLKSSAPAVLKKTVAELQTPTHGPIPESYGSVYSIIA